MADHANKRRIEKTFQPGEWVYLRLQPYRQTSLRPHQHTTKLSRRFYGPFQILAKVGQVAYKLALPESAKIHNVVHVSNLKQCHGDPTYQLKPLPTSFIDHKPVHRPVCIVGCRTLLHQGHANRQILVQWRDQPIADATWEDEDTLLKEFPDVHLEDKAYSEGGAHDAAISDKRKTLENQCAEGADSTTLPAPIARPQRDRREPNAL